MADPVKLSVITPTRQANTSSQRSYFILTSDSHNEPLRQGSVGCGACLDPSQTACRHISDHHLPTSSGTRSPALSYGNSDDEYSHGPMGNSATGVVESHDSSRETLVPRGRSRITELPQQLRNFQYGKLLNKFRNHPRPRPETVNEPQKSTNVLKLWKWEIFNCVLAFGMLESMHGVLLHYDGQRIPDWGTAINLSTLIALMATLLEMMLAFVVSEIIGQAKWDYFAGGTRPNDTAPVRRLIEASRFNEASHGMLGAVKLLPLVIQDPVTLIAVMVMTVSLGTSSFAQQAIQTQSCQFPVNSAHASLPVTRNLTGSRVTNFDTDAAVSLALGPENEDIGSPISVECSTGNCTFQDSIGGTYSTLGMCSSCVDVSSLITSTEQQCPYPDCVFATKVTLPNGMSINNITRSTEQSTSLLALSTEDMDLWTGIADLDWAGDLVSQDMKGLSLWATKNITMLAPSLVPSSGFSGFVAVSCTLYPCLRSYTSEIRLGKLNEVFAGAIPAVPDVVDFVKETDTTTVTTQDIESLLHNSTLKGMYAADYYKVVQSPCLVNGTVWIKEETFSTLNLQRVALAHVVPDPSGAIRLKVEYIAAPAECIYGADLSSLFALRTAMATALNGSCTMSIQSDDKNHTLNSEDVIMTCVDKFWLTSFHDGNEITAASIINRIQAFADRLSNKMRMGLLNDPEAVSGQVLQMTVCTNIYYSWLAFPAALVAITSGLLAWTMFRSSRRQGRRMVWKTSILPFLFYSERFVVQNGEDMSADSTESARRGEGVKEPLLDLDQMETEAKQRKVRFDLFN